MTWADIWEWLRRVHWHWDIASVQWIVTLALGAAFGVARWARRYQAKYWPVVYGPVQLTKGSVIYEGDRQAIVADVGYSYSVDGEYYGGYYTKRFSTMDKAETYAERFKGKTLPVHYDPRHPDKSVVIEQEAEQVFEMPLA